jgi:hypothetical protein
MDNVGTGFTSGRRLRQATSFSYSTGGALCLPSSLNWLLASCCLSLCTLPVTGTWQDMMLMIGGC